MVLPNGLREEDLELIGEGSQGKVYLLGPSCCIKIYKRREFLQLELEILLKAYNEPQFPKVFDWGEDYMIREYIPGIGLKEYLKQHPWSENIGIQLIELFMAFKRLGFNRMDTRMAHIIVTPEERLMAIDPANAMRKFGAFPKKILSQLEKLKYKQAFLTQLRTLNPTLYQEWLN